MSSASEIAEYLKERKNILIATHVFPDGDNMGSALALREAMQISGKKASCFLEGSIPVIFSWMPGADQIKSDLSQTVAELENSIDAIVVVDCGDLQRIGETFDKWLATNQTVPIVNIDHHTSNTKFGQINWVDPSYSSVGEMIYEIISHWGIQLTPTIAQNLYVSVYTDTGRFSFSNTNVRSLEYAARYVAAGASPITAFRNVYANRSLASFHLQAESFQTLQRFLDDRGCYFWVDQNMLLNTGTTIEDTEGFIDTVRTLRDFDIVVFFKEIGPKDIRVSVRAHPPINASALMSRFGGGGHPRAAGARLEMPLPAAIHHFISNAEKAIRSGEVLDTKDKPYA